MKYAGHNHCMNTLVILWILAILLETVYSAETLDVIHKTMRFWLLTYSYWAIIEQVFLSFMSLKKVSPSIWILPLATITHTQSSSSGTQMQHILTTVQKNSSYRVFTYEKTQMVMLADCSATIFVPTDRKYLQKIKIKYHNPRIDKFQLWPNILMPCATNTSTETNFY